MKIPKAATVKALKNSINNIGVLTATFWGQFRISMD